MGPPVKENAEIAGGEERKKKRKRGKKGFGWVLKNRGEVRRYCCPGQIIKKKSGKGPLGPLMVDT